MNKLALAKSLSLILLALLMVFMVTDVAWPEGSMDPISNEDVAWKMFGSPGSMDPTGYALVVLMIGLLLLVAMLGGVFLAKEEKE